MPYELWYALDDILESSYASTRTTLQHLQAIRIIHGTKRGSGVAFGF